MPNQDNLPVILLLAGPSGVGKDAIINQVRWRTTGLHVAITATTRPPRPGETNGKDYYFLSSDEYVAMSKGEKFLEEAQVYDHWYGVPRLEVDEAAEAGMDVLIRVDLKGARSLHKRLPLARLVYVIPGSFDELDQRLDTRNSETTEARQNRQAVLADEFRQALLLGCDYIITNRQDKLDEAAETLKSILIAERCRAR